MNDRAALTPSPVSPADAAALLRGRRTVDLFRAGECPGRETLREAIDVARWAPNHHRTEPWRFALLGPESQAAIIDLNTELLTASKGGEIAAAKRQRWEAMPGWLAVSCVRDEDPITAQEDYAACACAVQNLALYLHSAGVGTKWASGAVTRLPAFLDIIGADRDREYCVGLIWYGYPKRAPRSQRKSLDMIIRERP
ncbi:MAG: nitroreductase [Salinisphaera sp.]|jgi:nitroreductase|nr:nitroreductase [Salinisphaera sp.]